MFLDELLDDGKDILPTGEQGLPEPQDLDAILNKDVSVPPSVPLPRALTAVVERPISLEAEMQLSHIAVEGVRRNRQLVFNVEAQLSQQIVELPVRQRPCGGLRLAAGVADHPSSSLR